MKAAAIATIIISTRNVRAGIVAAQRSLRNVSYLMSQGVTNTKGIDEARPEDTRIGTMTPPVEKVAIKILLENITKEVEEEGVAITNTMDGIKVSMGIKR